MTISSLSEATRSSPIQIVFQAGEAGFHLTAGQVFEHRTVAALAAVAETAPAPEVEAGDVTGAVPLTPVQHWYFDQPAIDLHHFNQSLLLSVARGLEPRRLAAAFAHLLIHHDALRLRFEHRDGEWHQFHAVAGRQLPFAVLDLSAVPRERRSRVLENAAREVQASLDLTRGPLVRMVWLDLGPDRPGRLLWVIHHLLVDGVSWRILLQDLQRGYQQLSRG